MIYMFKFPALNNNFNVIVSNIVRVFLYHDHYRKTVQEINDKISIVTNGNRSTSII